MPTQEAWNERCKDVIHGGSSNFVAHHPSKINRDILAYEGTMYNVTNDSGEESYWSFAHDISERIRYEAQIKRLNQIMDTTINNLPAGIVVKEINNDFRYIYRNREAYNRDLYKNDPVGRMTSISTRLSWQRRRDRRIFKWPPAEKVCTGRWKERTGTET